MIWCDSVRFGHIVSKAALLDSVDFYFFVIGRIRLDWVGLGWIKAGLRLDWTRVEAELPEGRPGPA